MGIDNKNKDYPAKNVIKDYLSGDSEERPERRTVPKSLPKPQRDPDLDPEDDDIPF